MAKRYTVEFNAKITPVKPLNSEFTLCKCYVMALNKNRNLSYIGKDAADAALPTLFNIPVIGHLYVDNEGKYHMGGHDLTIVQNAEGQLEFKSMCVPYGVVPQQDNIHYEDIEEPNGDVKTYLVADVILWTGRFPELYEAIYSEDIYFGQSMEINVDDHAPLEEDKNYTNILNYTYSALCLLGKSDNADEHVEPCFPISRVEPYEFSVDDDKFSELMFQLKEELTHCFDNTGKGGEGMVENIEVVEEIVEPITEEFNQTVEEIVEPQEPVVETHSEVDEPVVTETTFSSTYKEKRDAISEALPFENQIDELGNVVHHISYWVCDFDDSYVYVERSEWDIDDGCIETKGRLAYTFDDSNKTASISGEFEEMLVKWLTKSEAEELESMRSNYEELEKYKNSREQKDREASYDDAIREFADLEGNAEFDTVYENRYSYTTIEALTDACYLIRGKFSIPAPKPKVTEPSIPVNSGANAPKSLRQRLHERYSNN